MATKLMDAAKKNKTDEFYTQLNDIELELRHYKSFFRNMTILCNCDDPFESNFFKYFAMNFNYLGIKKLICTCYDGSPIVGKQLSLFDYMEHEDIEQKKTAYKIEITEVKDLNNDGAIDIFDVTTLIKNEKNILTKLGGNGDFRSEECIELLKEADIIVTNPPFSLFREYLAQLVDYKKKFLIIGNKNAFTYKEVFALFQNNLLWTGYRNINNDMWFIVPDSIECEKIVDGLRLKHIMAVWFTNLPVSKHNEFLIPFKKYTPEKYPKYINYDAINVDSVADIPDDYYECIGVPITFLDKYNPEQFEIIRFRKGNDGKDLVYMREREREQPYFRIIVKRKRDRLVNLMIDNGCLSNEIDYCNGEMGVPITFLDKYNPEQFEIIALGIVGSIDFISERKMEILNNEGEPTGKYTVNAKGTLYRKWSIELDGAKHAAFKDCETGELYQSIYARVIVKRRK